MTATIPKLPDFSNDGAEGQWIDLCDQIIRASGVTDNKQKFLALYQKLPTAIAIDFRDLLVSNAGTTYADLVTRLRGRFTVPDYKKYQLAFERETMGNRSPKEFLRQLRAKFQNAGLDVPVEQLRVIFYNGLPTQMQGIAVQYNANQLDAAATAMDEFYFSNMSLVSQSGLNSDAVVASVGSLPKAGMQTKTIQIEAENSKEIHKLETTLKNHMEKNMDRLTRMMSDLKVKDTSGGNSSPRAQSSQGNSQWNSWRNNKGNSSWNNGGNGGHFGKNVNHLGNRDNVGECRCPPMPSKFQNYGLCFKHAKFGHRAYNCQKPCQWESFKNGRKECGNKECQWKDFFGNSWEENKWRSGGGGHYKKN